MANPDQSPTKTEASAMRAVASTKERHYARGIWFVLLVAPSVVLTLAADLTPNPLGHGTHTQLGLPPCGFLLVTGYRCPGCGLTTSFAHMMDLELLPALHASPFGVLLFVSVVGFMGVALWALFRGEPVFDTLERMRADRVALGLSAAALVNWAFVLGTSR